MLFSLSPTSYSSAYVVSFWSFCAVEHFHVPLFTIVLILSHYFKFVGRKKWLFSSSDGQQVLIIPTSWQNDIISVKWIVKVLRAGIKKAVKRIFLQSSFFCEQKKIDEKDWKMNFHRKISVVIFGSIDT